MNQILYTGGKNKGSKMSETQKIVVFLVVFIIIFAICLIAVGANLLNKVKSNENNNTLGSNQTNTTPGNIVESDVEIEFESEVGGVKVSVESTKKIEKFSHEGKEIMAEDALRNEILGLVGGNWDYYSYQENKHKIEFLQRQLKISNI